MQGSAKQRRIIFVGCLPPPGTGANIINKRSIERLQAMGFEVKAIDTSPRSLHRGAIYHAKRLSKVLSGLAELLFLSRGRSEIEMYISVGGGLAQIYDCLFTLLARAKGWKVFIHHHNFTYLAVYSRLHHALQVVAANAVQFVLCPTMRHLLKERYRVTGKILVVPNPFEEEVGSVAHHEKWAQRDIIRRIGFIGALSRDKGFDLFLATASALSQKGVKLEYLVAGTLVDPSLKGPVEWAKSAIPSIRFLGQVDGEAKDKFFKEIDLLIAPTKNDTAPLIINEAFKYGVPVIATEIGCIADQLSAGGGIGIPLPQLSEEAITEVVQKLLNQPKQFKEMATETSAALRRLRREVREGLLTFDQAFRLAIEGGHSGPRDEPVG